ncbi:hypothetical protein BDM02DRAFT_3193828 [Thelephora ganbajun]|uniref:Uncharacterized protein n=1 Tax=Thelephora ganbajun TaxID=370292 RepID=A0ACB6YXJ0_THEGA|nr:hypothetical protein BDM02DRAFT_3193828 [Thelephora ganbajun]
MFARTASHLSNPGSPNHKDDLDWVMAYLMITIAASFLIGTLFVWAEYMDPYCFRASKPFSRAPRRMSNGAEMYGPHPGSLKINTFVTNKDPNPTPSTGIDPEKQRSKSWPGSELK